MEYLNFPLFPGNFNPMFSLKFLSGFPEILPEPNRGYIIYSSVILYMCFVLSPCNNFRRNSILTRQEDWFPWEEWIFQMLNFTITLSISWSVQWNSWVLKLTMLTSARWVIDTSFKPFPTFTSLVSFFFALVILQEIFKVLCLIWALCSRNITPICGQSVFLPLLAAQPGMNDSDFIPAICCRLTELTIFVFEGFFESFNHCRCRFITFCLWPVEVSPWQGSCLYFFVLPSWHWNYFLDIASIFPLLQHACQVDKMSKNCLNQLINSSAWLLYTEFVIN